METFAKRLKFARERENLTQQGLAQKSGVKQPAISKMERGVVSETAGMIALARGCKCDPEWLESGVDKPGWINGRNSAPNQAIAHVEQAQKATKEIASLEGVLAALSCHLEQMDAVKRTAAATLLTVLSQSPGDQAIIAALVALLQPAAFTQQNRQAA